MTIQTFDSAIVWAILGLGFFVYYQIIFFIVRAKSGLYENSHQAWSETIAIAVGALPLLGLLGTIMGLLDAFTAMSVGEGLNESSVLTQGIASALWTTQLGLVMAVPAWLLLSYYKKLQTLEELSHAG
ncbi:MAG: MotA/TolQ/ExbB proton channel family protein [Psychrobium sp.]